MSQNNNPASATPESLLQEMSESSVTTAQQPFPTKILSDFMNYLIEKYSSAESVFRRDVPTVLEMCTLEAVILLTFHHMETSLARPESAESRRVDSRRGSQDRMDESAAINAQTAVRKAANHLLPLTIKLISLFYRFVRWNVIRLSESDPDSTSEQNTELDPDASQLLLQVVSGKCGKISSFSAGVSNYLPKSLKRSLEEWNGIQVDTTPFKNDLSSSDTMVQGTETSYHLQSILSPPVRDEQRCLDSSLSLKHVTNTLIKFGEELLMQSLPAASGSNHLQSILFDDFSSVIIPLHLDASLESFNGYCSHAIETIWGTKESEDFLTAAYHQALDSAYRLITDDFQTGVDEKILMEALKFIESLMSTSAGQVALEKYFCDSDQDRSGSCSFSTSEERDLVDLFLSGANPNLSSSYSARVLKLLAKLFEQTDKNPDTISLVRLCTSLTKLTRVSSSDSHEGQVLVAWMTKVLFTKDEKGELNTIANQENRLLLQNLTSYLVKESSAVDEDVAGVFLNALIPIASQMLSSSPEVMGFPDLMVIMASLAGSGTGSGHIILVKEVFGWLETCKKYLSQKDVLEKLEANISSGRHQVIIESTCYMLSYLADIFEALKLLSNDNGATGRSASPFEGDMTGTDPETDWMDDMTGPEDEDSNDEESDEDSLCNKLCTYTQTQREFMNQHWYHCHTCKMVDGVGTCSVCAKVCHKDHDVTYAKYGSFFCDCGAREDATCQALLKRPPEPDSSQYRLPAPPHLPSTTDGTTLASSLKRRASSPPGPSDESRRRNSDVQMRHQLLSRQLISIKCELLSLLQSRDVSGVVVSMLQFMTPSIISGCKSQSSMGASRRCRDAMRDLHTQFKKMEQSDHLMVPTLGSQEGAFENVKLSYSGEQGQVIRQLVSSHVIRRVAMCALTSPFGKRQHLAVSHEKGKITLLQLSALLRQADSSKKKLTLTRLASAPVPFTALSIAANPCNEDFLAVCGLKDCHVLTFSPSGNVLGHLVLQLQLEAGNHVIKALWLPGTQTQLAVVTSDFVKIFELSQNASSPEYILLPPSGKIRDVTFVFAENRAKHIILMTSTGHIYCQILNDESSARHGPFYVTTGLDVRRGDIRETSSGSVNDGGVSIYYSHTFQLLFIGYSNGKSFCAPLPEITAEISVMFPIEVKSGGSAVASSSSSPNQTGSAKGTVTPAAAPQPLCQWSEVPGHPGLVFAMSQTSNNPIVFMIKPDAFMAQEIRFLNVKAKITDMVALRHSTVSGEMRTTLILLCEDGSLRIYMAAQDATNFWLRPSLNAGQGIFGMSHPSSPVKMNKRKKNSKTRSSSLTASTTSFPVDFFEHCTQMSDIEFGGNDVLQVYNVQQLKNRLNTTGMYVASTKSSGFCIEIMNNDPSMVMVGARVLLGSQDIQRAPTYIELFGRSVQVYLNRSRWYDLPFTREESLTADKKIILTFGPSNDPNSVTMVDAIKIYGKTKESFVWPEDDVDDMIGSGAATSGPPQEYEAASSNASCQMPPQHLSSLDRFLSCSLEVLEGYFLTSSNSIHPGDEKYEVSLKIATQLLTLPFPSSVQQNIKSVLLTLHPNRISYNNHRDAAILNYVIKTLSDSSRHEELDGEAFHRLISITKTIAASRPSNLIKFSESLAAALAASRDDSSPADIEMKNLGTGTEDVPSSHSSTDRLSESQKSTSLPSPAVTSQRSALFAAETQGMKGSAEAIFISYLSEIFWKLYSLIPENPMLSAIPNVGLVHLESTVQALVEIIHAFTLVDSSNVNLASQLYLKLLLSENTTVSFAGE